MMMIDLILLAAIALWIFFRYKNVLGTPPDDDVQDRARKRKTRYIDEANSDNVITLKPDRIKEVKASADITVPSAAAAIVQIKMIDMNFDEDAFLDGAKKAFSIIVGAFANSDKETLKNLLDKSVYKSFVKVIDERAKQNHSMEFSLERLKKAEIVNASLQGKLASIAVQFSSEQISAIRDQQGVVVEGDPDVIVSVTDTWTFSRDLSSQDPNWLLTRTTTS
jgi:predicted lipid-binding transport protein (Tim44 family)